MLPDDAAFSKMQRQWEDMEERRMNALIEAHLAPDMEEEEDENHD